MLHSETAEAGRGRVWFGGGGGGHVRVGGHGSVSVHWSTPPRARYQPRGWSVGGSIYVGARYRPRYYRPYYYYPTYVPSYYGASYYPVAPAAAGPTNLRARVGTDHASRLVRSADPDERIRGIERAASM